MQNKIQNNMKNPLLMHILSHVNLALTIPPYLFNTHFNIILPHKSSSTKVVLSLQVFRSKLCMHFKGPLRATWSFHHIVLHLITIMGTLFVEELSYEASRHAVLLSFFSLIELWQKCTRHAVPYRLTFVPRKITVQGKLRKSQLWACRCLTAVTN